MKLFKNVYGLVGVTLLLSGGALLAEEQELELATSGHKKVLSVEEKLKETRPGIKPDMRMLIISTHTKIFGIENLFAEKNKETNEWHKMLASLQGYVGENAGKSKKFSKSFFSLNNLKGYVDKKKGKSKKFSEAFFLCQDVSDQLINTLKIIYNSVFSGTQIPSQPVVYNAFSNIKKLNKRITDLEDMSDMLEGTRCFSIKNKKAKKVLNLLIVTIKLTIKKSGNDLKKRVEQERKRRLSVILKKQKKKRLLSCLLYN